MWMYVTFLFVIYALYTLWDYVRIYRFVFTLNGPKTVPILGNANALLEKNLMQRFANEKSDYGRIFRIWVIFLPYVVLIEPEDIQVVLSSMKHTRKVGFYRLLNNFIGKGLISLEVDKWKVHRKILQPAFHLHVLKSFIATFSECADHLVNKLLERNGEEVNLTVFINNSVYDILLETILGISASRGDNNSKADMPFGKGQFMAIQRFVRPWLLINWIYRLTEAGKMEQQQQKNLINFCCRKMKEKQEFLQKNSSLIVEDESDAPIKKITLLEYMIKINEKNPSFIEQDIIEECCTFMLAGMESVSTSTALTLFLLALNRNWQERCIAELDEIFGDDRRSPTMQDLKEMKCLEMCIKESLRLYPSVPLFARVLGEDVRIGKQIIPAGCGIFILPYSTHRLPNHFPDPHDFKPERFSPENSKGRHPYAYLPFSAGPRDCIGQKFAILEMKSIISAILRRCRLESICGKEEVIPKFRMTIRVHGGLWVKVKPRDECNY
ncbi:probable cytochrome P450 4aa1 isoform X2 [Harpegnathos saltator]|uniref:Probable cytochrome P450 4aa1 n=2 Tax=Harpegnathos saltator TaxID=610380 RepID=E2C5Y6_HARSA|nr:probable cytochrome P450 4aa1 isoform X2 [Harpegnathos saltator]XP_011151402.1 probable cytochrome P450 4aa1 isoform X2 [Harpegnathos saltator]XP_011151403.1 probable cytochrome P450 4aa1 isoform X2 [Harpegnathos saltator]EFN76645.1 Probable cytochrome P450 4aa1 [Harpegnathos saltator]